MKISPEKLAKMKVCAHLLPEPGGEVLVEAVNEIYRLRLALEEILNPILFIEQRAKVSGHIVNYDAAVNLSMDSKYLKSIAKAAL